jgi:hypothetical protein
LTSGNVIEGESAMDDLSEAERQFVDMMRSIKNFTLTIREDGGGRWFIRLKDHFMDVSGEGRGSDFTRAWDDVVDPHLRPSPVRLVKPPVKTE